MEREKAIAHVKDMYAHMIFREDKEALETLIPELAESKDERIRKWLVNYFTEIGENWIHREFTCEQIIAYLEKQKEHQSNSDAPNESSWEGMISSSNKDKNLDEIAQDYVDGVKEYNPEPTWDLIQTAVCYGYHFRANHQVLDDKHLLSAIQVQFASHAKVENRKRYVKLTWDEFKKIVFELCSRGNQKEQKPAEWDEKDEKVYDYLKSGFEYASNNPNLLNSVLSGASDATIQDYRNFIDKLKILRPQSKQEWSEEDEKKLELVIDCIYEFYPDPVMKYKLKDWLKSLRPHWKPSEEQMAALKEASASWMNEKMGNAELLQSLYDALKKLM